MRRFVPALGLVLVSAFASGRARADISSWANASGGPSFIEEGVPEGETEALPMQSQGALSFQAGLGTTPSGFLIGGGGFHLETHFTKGTDLGLLGRLATQGYVLGNWGAALDAGGYARFWGVHSQGGLGALVLGAPWGITLRSEVGLGTHDSRMFGVMLGVDFVRLTVFRSSGTGWFPNPFPGHKDEK